MTNERCEFTSYRLQEDGEVFGGGVVRGWYAEDRHRKDEAKDAEGVLVA